MRTHPAVLAAGILAAMACARNRLTAQVHVGHGGANDSAVRSLDDVLRTHELVKVQISKHADLKAKELARQLAVGAISPA